MKTTVLILWKQFLQNVGVKIRNCRSSLQNVQAQLEVERRTNVEQQSIVNNQREAMNDLLKQMQETEQARIKTKRRIGRSKLCWRRNLSFC